MNCDMVSTKGSGDPKGISGTGMALHGCPELRQGAWMCVASTDQPLGRGFLPVMGPDLPPGGSLRSRAMLLRAGGPPVAWRGQSRWHTRSCVHAL